VLEFIIVTVLEYLSSQDVKFISFNFFRLFAVIVRKSCNILGLSSLFVFPDVN
jgi:hypothetical protein